MPTRLRRIKQLGLSSYTYTSSNHDRFSHSIGVCFLAGLMVENLNFTEAIVIEPNETYTLNKRQVKLLVRLAAILHDIGHGPFSHAFERAIKSKVEKYVSASIQIHEDYSIKIIQSERISSIFAKINDEIIRQNGIKWVCDILEGTFAGPKWIKEIISSQFDADRIDYLLRDAYMSGVKYAAFDWEWIFRNMFIGNIPGNGEGIIIDGSKGTHSLESFIVSRYHMYEQVYFHKTTRGFEAIVNSIFKRIGVLLEKGLLNEKDFLGKYFLNFLNDYNSIEDYLQLDDYYMISHFHHWSKNSSDDILKKLCLCFVHRQPFKMIKVNTNREEDIESGMDEYHKLATEYKAKMDDYYDYFFLKDSYKDNPYKDTYLLSKSGASERIWISSKNGPKDLAEESKIIKGLRNEVLAVTRIYVHRDYYSL
jgi:HD superfamily phosphohydrolase